MSDDEWFSALSAAADQRRSGPALNFPYRVEGKDVSAEDPNEHFLIVRRLDIAGAPQRRLFLTPVEMSLVKTSSQGFRPHIVHFAFPAYESAMKAVDAERMRILEQSDSFKHFIADGGIVLGEGIEETEQGDVARWISPIKRSASDTTYFAYIGFASVYPRGSKAFEVDYIHQANAIVTTDRDELHAAIGRALQAEDHNFGTPAFHLRFLRHDVEDRIAGVQMLGDVFALRPQLAQGVWTPTPADAYRRHFFERTPVGQKLASQDWPPGTLIEVIPSTVRQVQRSAVEAAQRRHLDLTLGFKIEGGVKVAEKTGYSRATTRVRLNHDEQGDPTYSDVGAALPIEVGAVIDLKDLPTGNYRPGQKTLADNKLLAS